MPPLTVTPHSNFREIPKHFCSLALQVNHRWLIALEGDNGHLTLSKPLPPGMPPCWTQKLPPEATLRTAGCSCLGLGCGRLWSLSSAAGLDLMNPSFSCPYQLLWSLGLEVNPYGEGQGLRVAGDLRFSLLLSSHCSVCPSLCPYRPSNIA